MVEERSQDSKSRGRSLGDTIRRNGQVSPRKTRTHIRALSPEVRKASGGKMVRRREIKAKTGRDSARTGPRKEAERQGQPHRDSHLTPSRFSASYTNCNPGFGCAIGASIEA